jgi:hypothetical protein
VESEVTTVGLPAADGLSDDGLAAEVVRAHRERCRGDAREADLVGEAEHRGLARQEGYASTTAWLVAVTGESAPACRGKLAVASALEEMPVTCEAFASGELSETRVRLLAQAQALAPVAFAEGEAQLVAEVAAVSVQEMPKVLAAWKHSTDLQAAEVEAERLHTQRALHLSADWSGMLRVNGLLDPEGGSALLAAIRSLSEAAALNSDDPRTSTQCRADALVEISRRHLDSTPGTGTARPHVTVTIPGDTLRRGSGLVDLEAGPITAQTVRRLACDATLSRIIVDPDGIPVGTSQARRVIPPAVRRALDLRDGHCTHQGCQIPARWCDAHHIIHWADGGQTRLSNPRLPCRCHRGAAHDHQPMTMWS